MHGKDFNSSTTHKYYVHCELKNRKDQKSPSHIITIQQPTTQIRRHVSFFFYYAHSQNPFYSKIISRVPTISHSSVENRFSPK